MKTTTIRRESGPLTFVRETLSAMFWNPWGSVGLGLAFLAVAFAMHSNAAARRVPETLRDAVNSSASRHERARDLRRQMTVELGVALKDLKPKAPR